MIGYLFVILAQLSYALGAVILKKQLEKYSGIPLTLFSLSFSGALAFALLILIIAGFTALPGFFLLRSQAKQLLLPQNLPWVIAYSVFFVFLGELLLIMGYIKGKSLIILSLSALFYPLFVSLGAIIFIKESISLKILIGGILMVTGYFLLVF